MADFVLGRIRFQFKGEWTTATSYIKDDCVEYGGNVYVVKENHTSNADFYVDLAATKVAKFTSGQAWKGAWAATTYYKVDEVVSWGGKNYICNTGHTSQASLYDDTAKWTEYNSGFAWKGAYTNATAYKLNDVVKYGASTYICNTQHTAGATLDETKFDLFASGLEFEDSWLVGTQYQLGDVVTYGGYNYVAARQNVGVSPYNNTSDWEVLSTGFKLKSTYNNSTAYNPGDVVIFGGHSFSAKVDTTGNTPDSSTHWEKIVEGFTWKDSWADTTVYNPGDTVSHLANSYRCKLTHTAANGTNDPVTDSSGTYWDVLAEGDSQAVLTQQGDVLSRNSTANFRVPIGTAGQVLKVNAAGQEPEWGYSSVVPGVYYVGKNGVDDATSGRGTTPDKPYLSIKYACTALDTAAKSNPDASARLTLNKEWLKDEIVAWIAQQVFLNTSNTGSPWYNYTYDNAKCQRDIGYLVDSLDHDMVYGGNAWIRQLAMMYWANDTYPGGPSGDTAMVDGTREPERLAHEKLRDMINNNVFTGTAYSSLQSPVITTQNTTGNNGEAGTDALITASVLIDTNALDTGLSSLPTLVTPTAGARTLFVRTGIYEEQLPILVPEGVAVMGDEMRSVTVKPTAGTSDDGSTPNNRSDMFQMTEKTTVRGMTMTGLIGQLASASADGYQRPTESAGATRSGVAVALNPNGLVYRQSPFVQNAVHVSYSGAVGIKIDGGLQPMGYDSILSNDFTQICDDGIGVWAKNGGRSEIVSVFTYYCHMGYLADSGGTIRAANCNNSYGEYGAVSSGVDPLEVPTVGTVNTRSEQAVVGRVLAGHNTAGTNGVLRVEFEYAGNNYNRGVIKTITNIGAAHANRVAGAYSGVSQDGTTGSGTLSTYNIDVGGSGQITNLTILSGGSGHAVTDTITINDSQLGNGGAPALTFDVATLEVAAVAFTGSGTSADVTLAVNDGGIRHVDVVSQGDGHITTSSSAQTGTATSITLALADPRGTGFYNGMRLTITDGTGAGQTGVVDSYNGTTKVAAMKNEAGAPGWDYFGTRVSAEAALDATTTYEIEPRVHLTGGGAPTRDGLVRAKVESGKISKIFIIDSGEGYSAAPTVIITDPNATTLATATAEYGNGVIASQTLTAAGSGYQTATTKGIISGDGYSDINPVGQAFIANGLSKAPKPGTAFEFTGSSVKYLVVAATNYQGQTKFTPTAAAYTPTTGELVLTIGTHSLTTGQFVEIANNSLTFTCAHDSHATQHTYPRSTDPAGNQASVTISAIAATTITVNVGVSPNTTAHTFVIAAANSVTSGLGQATIECSPNIVKAESPAHTTAITFREKYSNIRMTGHDFLDIGTGSFADTNYPTEEPKQLADADDEVIEAASGRVFYTSTDQDGNYRVGDLFKVHQATGKATLNAESFDLSGLQELSLGSVALGNFGATITEFSTDGTLASNSDGALVTEKAIRTYVETQLGGGSNNLTVNEILVGQMKLHSNILVTTATNGDLKLQTDGTGKILLEAQTQTAIAPSVSTDVTNKVYVDEEATSTTTALYADPLTGALMEIRSTNFNVPSQEATLPNTDMVDTQWFHGSTTTDVAVSSKGHLQLTVT